MTDPSIFLLAGSVVIAGTGMLRFTQALVIRRRTRLWVRTIERTQADQVIRELVHSAHEPRP